MYAGFLFDLDGTIFDSQLDFAAIAKELGIAVGTPILEHIEQLPVAEQQQAMQIVEQHELLGAKQATPVPGALEFIAYLYNKQLPVGILTRNMRSATTLMLAKHQLDIDLVITREDCSAKPDPAGIFLAAKHWNIEVAQLVYIGDFRFDMLTAQNAGCDSCLVSNHWDQRVIDGARKSNQQFADMATWSVNGFEQLYELWFGGQNQCSE